MSEQKIEEWFSRILSRDAMTFEDAYWGERPASDKIVPKILKALETTHDSYTRGKLIELLGECEDPSVLPVLEAEARSSDESNRGWADAAIEALARSEPWQKNPKYL